MSAKAIKSEDEVTSDICEMPHTDESSKNLSTSPIDSCYSWFVILLVGTSFLLGAGFFRSFTLVYQKLLLRYDQGATLTALVAGLHGCIKLCSSMISLISLIKYPATSSQPGCTNLVILYESCNF